MKNVQLINKELLSDIHEKATKNSRKRINYDFYQPRTIHESSLSPAIHSILAAELGHLLQGDLPFPCLSEGWQIWYSGSPRRLAFH